MFYVIDLIFERLMGSAFEPLSMCFLNYFLFKNENLSCRNHFTIACVIQASLSLYSVSHSSVVVPSLISGADNFFFFFVSTDT